MITNESLMALYEACRNTPPCLIPNRIREALLRCALQNGDDPLHSEDGPTPEAKLREAVEIIDSLLENLGYFDRDGLEPFPEWNDANAFARSIGEVLPDPSVR